MEKTTIEVNRKLDPVILDERLKDIVPDYVGVSTTLHGTDMTLIIYTNTVPTSGTLEMINQIVGALGQTILSVSIDQGIVTITGTPAESGDVVITSERANVLLTWDFSSPLVLEGFPSGEYKLTFTNASNQVSSVEWTR